MQELFMYKYKIPVTYAKALPLAVTIYAVTVFTKLFTCKWLYVSLQLLAKILYDMFMHIVSYLSW